MLKRLLTALALLATTALAACQTPAAENPTLKIGLLPIVETLPLHVAEAEGYFKEQKVNVELITFASAVERDGAMQAKQIDAQLNDLVATMLLSKGADKVKVVRQTFQGSPAMPMMYLLAAPQSPIRAPADLRGAEIGVSTNSVIEYATDAMLAGAGLQAGEAKRVEVAKIPVRFEMLMKGQLQAATMPDPFASLAIAQGAKRVLDDSASGAGQSVLTFRQAVLDAQPAAAKAFLVAYEKGVQAINAEPNKYRALLVDRAKVPDQIKDSFAMPPFAAARVPTEKEVADVSAWMVAKGLLPAPANYADIVTAAYLPGK